MTPVVSPATLLHVGDAARGQAWQALLPELVPDLTVRQWPDIGDDPGAIRYLAAWAPPADLFARLPALEVVFSVGAGVDHLDADAIPAGIPLVRMIEPGLVAGMVEYATFAVLALHRDMLGHAERHRHGQCAPGVRREAGARRVGIMGLGAMGAAIAEKLVAFGFPVSGWSRSPRTVDGVTCHAGAAALPAFLAASDILICVLPLTDATRGIIDASLLAQLPAGAGFVNMGRGGHVDEAALLAAVRGGHIAGAILDVTAVEPLPADHPFRAEPRILVTPHIAGTTSVEGGARAIADNILRHRRGAPLTGAVDRGAGY